MSKRRHRVPMTFQMEAAECGAACVCMMLRHFGRETALEEVRSRCKPSRNGTTAGDLVRVARTFGLRADGRKLSLAGLSEQAQPVIVHWGFSHFVVLEEVTDAGARVCDPALGRRLVSHEELGRRFTGVALTFEPDAGFERRPARRSATLGLLSEFASAKGRLLPLLVLGLVLAFGDLALAGVVQAFVDEKLGGDRTWARHVVAALLALALIVASAGYAQRHIFAELEQRMATLSSARFVAHLAGMPIALLYRRYGADLARRSRLPDRVASLATGELGLALLRCLLTAAHALAMLLLSLPLGLAVIVLALVSWLIHERFLPSQREAAQTAAQLEGRLASWVVSRVAAIQSVKSGGIEDEVYGLWCNQRAQVLAATRRQARVTRLLQAVPVLLGASVTALIFTVGGLSVAAGTWSVGGVVAFNAVALGFLQPLAALFSLRSELEELSADVARLDDVWQLPSEPREVANEPSALVATGAASLSVSDLSFKFSESEVVLRGISFTLAAGGSLAIVGRSGSGKTTLLRLLCRLIEADSGQIRLDGLDLRQLTRGQIAARVMQVEQAPVLFADSVHENVTLGREATPSLVRVALDGFGLEHIATDRVLAEQGNDLSGGERQRLDLARCQTDQRGLLLIDEVTSGLDPETEDQVWLRLRAAGATLVTATHRRSVAMRCDAVLVLEGGVVVEHGEPLELSRNPESHFSRSFGAGNA